MLKPLYVELLCDSMFQITLMAYTSMDNPCHSVFFLKLLLGLAKKWNLTL